VLNTTCALAVALTLQSAAPQVPPPEAADRPIHDFFRNLGRDLVALPSIDSAVVVGVGTGAAFLVHPFDPQIDEWVDKRERASYTEIGEFLGDAWVEIGTAAATYGIGALSGQREVAHIGSDLIRAQALNAVFTRGMKSSINRTRPNGGSHSMPSGHASASFATAAVLERHYGPRLAIPAYALAGFISWTRLRDDSHWLTDVVVGATIGTTIGRTVSRGHRDRNDTWHVLPVASSQRIAIYVVRARR
jgi:membrane-associated phospholipid phosphatase